jgi:hypothetical protein
MTPPQADRAAMAGAGADGKITQDVVLAAALDIIDRDGTEGLSMRRLARALNRDPMILIPARAQQGGPAGRRG